MLHLFTVRSASSLFSLAVFLGMIGYLRLTSRSWSRTLSLFIQQER